MGVSRIQKSQEGQIDETKTEKLIENGMASNAEVLF
jgi:hypothetical protein